MTHTDPNPRPSMSNTKIAYHSEIQTGKENTLQACVEKMTSDGSSLKYYPEDSTAANEGGLGFLRELRAMQERIERLENHRQAHDEKIGKLETHRQAHLERIERLETHRQAHLNLRQRAIATFVRDALEKETEARKEAIRELNKTFVYAGDCQTDAIVCIERYKKKSTEWDAYSTLYGLTPEQMSGLDGAKCPLSMGGLDRIASYLLQHNKSTLPSKAVAEARESIVSLLLQGKYEEAEASSSTLQLS